MTDDQRKRLFVLLRKAAENGWPTALAGERQLLSIPNALRLTAIQHALWMLDQLEAGEIVDDSKLNRWVGFIQGVLWAKGFSTIDELREMIPK